MVADIQEVIDMSSRRTKGSDCRDFWTGWVGILFTEGTIYVPSRDKFKHQLRPTHQGSCNATTIRDFAKSVRRRPRRDGQSIQAKCSVFDQGQKLIQISRND